MPKADAATQATRETPPSPFPDGRVPAWEVAYLFPPQGAWTEDDYWALEGFCEGAVRVELANGCLEVLPVPIELHQYIMLFMYELLKAFAKASAPGAVLVSGTNVRIAEGVIRDPDVVYMKAENANRRHKQYWDGADLVMEVVSEGPKDHKRDWEDKPKDYARAGIPEYWIIDPQQQVIRVLTLKGKSYRVHGDFGPGTQATSVLLPGFTVAVDEALAPPGSNPEE